MDRRIFLESSALAASSLLIPSFLHSCKTDKIPSYLKGYANEYAKNPKDAALSWFRDAKFGLFMHYGLYSQLGRGEWVQFRENIHIVEYDKLKSKFTAENFDAAFITDLAVNAVGQVLVECISDVEALIHGTAVCCILYG